jgi:hypothetical protein
MNDLLDTMIEWEEGSSASVIRSIMLSLAVMTLSPRCLRRERRHEET